MSIAQQLLPNATHVVVGVDVKNAVLKQAASAGEFRPGMDLVASVCGGSFAEAFCRTCEQLDDKRQYYVMDVNALAP